MNTTTQHTSTQHAPAATSAPTDRPLTASTRLKGSGRQLLPKQITISIRADGDEHTSCVMYVDSSRTYGRGVISIISTNMQKADIAYRDSLKTLSRREQMFLTCGYADQVDDVIAIKA